jgi:hypothetical protein
MHPTCQRLQAANVLTQAAPQVDQFGGAVDLRPPLMQRSRYLAQGARRNPSQDVTGAYLSPHNIAITLHSRQREQRHDTREIVGQNPGSVTEAK